ncbi:MAG: hypothetical protein R3B98_05600 [Hyphomonas sp.]
MNIRKRAVTAAVLLGGSMMSTACLSTSINSRPSVRSDGMGSDLRILFDDHCWPAPELAGEGPDLSDRSLGLGGELAFQAGTLLFDSVGAWLQQMGAPKIDRSTGIVSGKLFSSPEMYDFNRNIGCVYVVRSGFEPGGPSFGNAPPEFVADWTRLGLLSRPTFYAEIKLTPDEERSGYFTGDLQKMVALDFERDARYDNRDYLLVMDFERPEPRTYVQFANDGSVQFSEASGFARGVFKLPAVKRGQYVSGAAAKALETGWMPLDFSGMDRDSGIFNLYVDVLELKRGDPLLSDIGSLLRSDSVQRAAADELRDQIDKDGKREREADQRTDELVDQRQLTRSLDSAVLDLRRVMASEFADSNDLIAAIEPVEDALFDIERHQNWRGELPTAKMQAANDLLAQADTKLNELLASELGGDQ